MLYLGTGPGHQKLFERNLQSVKGGNWVEEEEEPMEANEGLESDPEDSDSDSERSDSDDGDMVDFDQTVQGAVRY